MQSKHATYDTLNARAHALVAQARRENASKAVVS